MSHKTNKSVLEKFREVNIHKHRMPIEVIAKELLPVTLGIINYYCKFSSGSNAQCLDIVQRTIVKMGKMEERAIQNGIFQMVEEQIQRITFMFSTLAIGKSLKCSCFCD